MRRRTFRESASGRGLTWSALVLTAAVAVPFPAASDEQPLVWRMNSLLHPRLFGEAGEHFARSVQRLSDGSLVIEVHDRLVLDQDTFAALESGLVDAVWGSAGHHHREDPALTIFGGFPFGPDPAGFSAWMQAGGGAEVLDAIYARHGLKSLYCGALPAEGGGWFLTPFQGPDSLKGMAIRSFGYGARVLSRLGAVTYELPAGEIRAAFAAGLIEAADFSLPAIDAELGLADVAENLYFPGWQQPATPLEILMTGRTWEGVAAPRLLHGRPLSQSCHRLTLSTNSGRPASNCMLGPTPRLSRFGRLGPRSSPKTPRVIRFLLRHGKVTSVSAPHTPTGRRAHTPTERVSPACQRS
jgi:TRAP-type mannitol/chloroaromatic compound transport system substrate-binding protein